MFSSIAVCGVYQLDCAATYSRIAKLHWMLLSVQSVTQYVAIRMQYVIKHQDICNTDLYNLRVYIYVFSALETDPRNFQIVQLLSGYFSFAFQIIA